MIYKRKRRQSVEPSFTSAAFEIASLQHHANRDVAEVKYGAIFPLVFLCARGERSAQHAITKRLFRLECPCWHCYQRFSLFLSLSGASGVVSLFKCARQMVNAILRTAVDEENPLDKLRKTDGTSKVKFKGSSAYILTHPALQRGKRSIRTVSCPC